MLYNGVFTSEMVCAIDVSLFSLSQAFAWPPNKYDWNHKQSNL